jgi:hypothetical protein
MSGTLYLDHNGVGQGEDGRVEVVGLQVVGL